MRDSTSLLGSACHRPLFLAALALATQAAWSQVQTNSPQGALSINGTGHLESNVLVPTNSQSATTPSATAPAYTHRTAPLASLELRVEGNPNRPFVLAIGTVGAVPFIIGAQRVELDFATIQTFIDGSAPGIYNSFANTGNSGSWSMILPGGVPAGFPTYALQGAVFDPTVVSGVRITGTVALQTQNTIDTLNRNLLDAYFQSPRHPQYLTSLLTSTFMDNGYNSAQFVAGAAWDMTPSPEEGTPLGLDYLGFGPNATNAPALPTGAPTAGQTVTEYVEMRNRYSYPCLVLPSPVSAHRTREYDFILKEQGGVWRFNGNQRAVECEIQLQVRPATVSTAQNQGLAPHINIHLSDELQLHGGIAFVTCSGPQLSSVNGFGQSTSAASGSQQLQSSGDSWYINVQLASAGTSVLPLVENGAGPRDVYTITVTWNDNTTSGPYTLPLRSAIDVAASPALALAAMPGLALPALTASLSQAGLPTASCTVNFTDGVFPVGVPLAQSEIQIIQGNNGWHEVEGLIPAAGLAQSYTICTPFLSTGAATLTLTRQDIFRSEYQTQTNLNL